MLHALRFLVHIMRDNSQSVLGLSLDWLIEKWQQHSRVAINRGALDTLLQKDVADKRSSNAQYLEGFLREMLMLLYSPCPTNNGTGIHIS